MKKKVGSFKLLFISNRWRVCKENHLPLFHIPFKEEEKFASQQKAKLEEEKNKIKNDESIIAEERKKMLEKIEEKEKEMKKVSAFDQNNQKGNKISLPW